MTPRMTPAPRPADDARARTLAPWLVLVATERCATAFPTPHELCRAFGLTQRETHVALLLAGRRSNREIATELCVTEHTARRHTEKVLLKLGIHRRAEVHRTLLRHREFVNGTARRGRDLARANVA